MYWEELEAPLPLLVACVANQVDIYDWPGVAETMDKYKQPRRGPPAGLPGVGGGKPHTNRPSTSLQGARPRLACTTSRMLGAPEACAESIASLLNIYILEQGVRAGTDRIMENVKGNQRESIGNNKLT